MSSTTATNDSVKREDETISFLGTLVTVRASGEDTDGRLAVVEQLAPSGFGTPLHVHRRENEWFYVLEGELTLWVGGEIVVARAGSFAYGPRDVPHTFLVTSPGPARFLLGAEPAGFEDFVRALGEPTQSVELRESDGPLDVESIVTVGAEFGIEILGPPGIPA